MADLLRCTDRQGRVVVLSEDCWLRKIVVDHADMNGQEACIALTLQDPASIRHDRTHPRRECFYRANAHARFPRLYVKVVVEFTDASAGGVQEGRVVTAYLTDAFKHGEQERWPTSTPATPAPRHK